MSGDCLKVLTLSVTFLRGVQKWPQIWTVWKERRSPEGVSLAFLFLEFWQYITVILYSVNQRLPIHAYSEYPILASQNLVLLHLTILRSRLNPMLQGLIMAHWLILLAVTVTDATCFPPRMVDPLMRLSVVFSVSSKFAQLRVILRQREAGENSVLSWAINVYACLVSSALQVMSTKRDALLLTSSTVSLVLSATILAAILVFRPRKDKAD